nr:MAG TPA: hypothetical protein [Caudoviricetes sp.]
MSKRERSDHGNAVITKTTELVYNIVVKEVSCL